MKEESKANIWIPMRKNFETNKYEAILSDTSIDRDGEFMSEGLIKKWGSDPNKYIPMLMDHQNKMLALLGKWTNPQVLQKGEHYALKMEPKWFTSNPNAKIIKDMMDEGAEPGLSIGAIPKSSSVVDINGEKIKRWDDAELIEASIVPVGSNRGSYMRIAKSFNLGGKKMSDEIKKNEDIENETHEEANNKENNEKTEETNEKAEETNEKSEEEANEIKEEIKEETKNLKEEIEKLRKEILELEKKRLEDRQVELKAISENTDSIEQKPIIKSDMSVWEQIAMLKGVKSY